ncbi:hypothetical protein HDU76_004383 [Blyttiomyces sp. JEL0837]|nr:hypothetical protein HDU76_004383 [Blyttiomyces sp. JEL0837]
MMSTTGPPPASSLAAGSPIEGNNNRLPPVQTPTGSGPDTPYQFIPISQSRGAAGGGNSSTPAHNRSRVHSLILRQQPKHSRMCGFGEKVDRRPVDPPPIIQLEIKSNGTPEESAYLYNPYYFMYASLISPESEEELHLLRDGKTRSTTGSIVSSLYRLKDLDNKDGAFFVFPDLSVRMEGSYRLKFSLFEIVNTEIYYCTSICSDVFHVYPAKKFPGMEESTYLSRNFAEQGLKIRIRKELRARSGRPSVKRNASEPEGSPEAKRRGRKKGRKASESDGSPSDEEEPVRESAPAKKHKSDNAEKGSPPAGPYFDRMHYPPHMPPHPSEGRHYPPGPEGMYGYGHPMHQHPGWRPPMHDMYPPGPYPMHHPYDAPGNYPPHEPYPMYEGGPRPPYPPPPFMNRGPMRGDERAPPGSEWHYRPEYGRGPNYPPMPPYHSGEGYDDPLPPRPDLDRPNQASTSAAGGSGSNSRNPVPPQQQQPPSDQPSGSSQIPPPYYGGHPNHPGNKMMPGSGEGNMDRNAFPPSQSGPQKYPGNPMSGYPVGPMPPRPPPSQSDQQQPGGNSSSVPPAGVPPPQSQYYGGAHHPAAGKMDNPGNPDRNAGGSSSSNPAKYPGPPPPGMGYYGNSPMPPYYPNPRGGPMGSWGPYGYPPHMDGYGGPRGNMPYPNPNMRGGMPPGASGNDDGVGGGEGAGGSGGNNSSPRPNVPGDGRSGGGN